MRFLYLLALFLVLGAQYSLGYSRGLKAAEQATKEAKAAVEGWTAALQEVDRCQKIAKEALDLCRE